MEEVNLIDAIKANDFELIKQIIREKGITDLNIQTETGDTPLIYSVKYGTPEIVEFLIDSGLSNINMDDGNLTPLMVACMWEPSHGNIDMVKSLIERGADLEITDTYESTALLIATRGSLIAVVEYLINAGANINAQNVNNQTPLHLSCVNENLDMVNLFRERGADLELVDGDGNTALLIASSTDNLEIILYLIDAGANIDAKNIDGDNIDIILENNDDIDPKNLMMLKIKLLQKRLVNQYSNSQGPPLGGGKSRKSRRKRNTRRKSKTRKKSKRNKKKMIKSTGYKRY